MIAVPLRYCLVGMALALVCLLHPPLTLAADTARIAPSLYPSHTIITSIVPLGNAQMDCDWGFACHDGQPAVTAPLYHLRTQDDLHRLAGWAQFGDRRSAGRRMLFALFASRYSAGETTGMPWNVQAFADFRGALMALGFSDRGSIPRLVPPGAVGNASRQIARSPDGDVLAMACWTGSIEVEGMVVYAHGSSTERTLALHDLTRQVRAAVTVIESNPFRS